MASASSFVKTFVFAFVMCLVCGFLLTLAAEGLKERKLINIEIDKQTNILKALGLLEPQKKYTSSEIMRLYETNVNSQWINSSGELVSQLHDDDSDDDSDDDLIPLFVYRKNGEIEAYAMHYEAYGLWSWVKGYFSLKSDGATVQGFTVYSHMETPGLGGECEKPWFQNQFKGKRIVNTVGEFVSIGVVKGLVKDVIGDSSKRENYVDGMSGATITGKGIERYLYDTLKKYEGFSKKLRSEQL